MKIYKNSFDLNHHSDSLIFIDTNVFVVSTKYDIFRHEIITPLKVAGATLLTIPSVQFEFSRGTSTLQAFAERNNFIQKIVDSSYPIERHLNDVKQMIPVFQSVCNKASYTDFLLGLCLYKFSHLKNVYVMTENFKDFPLPLFKREEIITLDLSDDIRHQCLISLDTSKLQQCARRLIA